MSETLDTSSIDDIDRATGPVAAALLAAGVGAFTLGLLTTLNEASTGIHDFLELTDGVGPLGGKTTFAVVAYFGSWAALHALWRRESPVLRPILIAAAVLVGLGLLGTFPVFFQAFVSE